ncbi:hypothetical protein EDB85DRAFT_1899577 [Lactarius pseudohatsudake]|nr:hypothetical protein EDB85DRAFT_1899577 [Lactarius pseudohatsudake]
MSLGSGSPSEVVDLAPFARAHPFRLTEPPNKNWKVGEGLPENTTGARLESRRGTRMEDMGDGKDIGGVWYTPPVSFRLSPRQPKNTRDNILATKEFVVNLISEPFVEAANEASVEAPADISEWDVSGLTQIPSVHVKPARVKESALFQSQDIFPDGSTIPSATLVLGRVRYVHVRNSVLQPDGLRANPAKLRPVSRISGLTYARLGEGFNLQRPEWSDVKRVLEAK